VHNSKPLSKIIASREHHATARWHRVRGRLPAVKYLHLNETDGQDVNDLDRAQVRHRQTARRPIDPDRLIDIAVRLIERNSIYDIGMGLALLCGRRPYEIFKTGTIELADADQRPILRPGQN
jgi:hypothetical protein